MAPRPLLATVLLSCLSAASGWGWGAQRGGAAPPARFSVVPAAAQAAGQGRLAVLQAEAGKETFLDRMLGVNCYSRAVEELGADCRGMDQEQRSRLALRLTNCQLATQGEPTHPCSDAQLLRECTAALPDRAYQLYVEFLGHAANICLFIQNQNFEKYTERMLNQLAEGGTLALDQLRALGEQTAAEHAHIAQQARDIATKAEESLQLGREQREVQQELLEAAKGHREESLAYYESLNTRTREVLGLQGKALHNQELLQAGQVGLARQLSEGSQQVEGLFSFIDDRAQRQLVLQRAHEAQQAQLTSDLRALAADTQGIRSLVDVVLRYEQRSDAALIKLLGRSYTLEDAAFYGAGLLGVTAAGVAPGAARARLPVLALLCSSLVGERLLLARLHMFLERDPAEELVVYLPTDLLPLPGLASPGPTPLNVKWALRKAVAGLALLVLLYSLASHRNYEREGCNALRRMEVEAKAANASHLERLARIEQRLAAIHAWEQQRLALERQAVQQRQQQLLPPATPARGAARTGAKAQRAANTLLPPALLLMDAAADHEGDCGMMGPATGGCAEASAEGEQQAHQPPQRHVPAAGQREVSAPMQLPGHRVEEGAGAAAEAVHPREHKPATPSSHAAAARGRKRRGSEDVPAPGVGEAGEQRGRGRRRSDAGEHQAACQPQDRQAKRRGSAAAGADEGQGTASKRARR